MSPCRFLYSSRLSDRFGPVSFTFVDTCFGWGFDASETEFFVQSYNYIIISNCTFFLYGQFSHQLT